MRFFTDDKRFFAAVIFDISRALMPAYYIRDSEHQTSVGCLRQAISQNGIIAKDLDQVDGLRTVYESGWLYAEYMEDGGTVYGFPSLVHFKYLASLQT